jgi:hypothetical protein
MTLLSSGSNFDIPAFTADYPLRSTCVTKENLFFSVLSCQSPPAITRGFVMSPEDFNRGPWLIGFHLKYRCDDRYMIREDNSSRVCERPTATNLEPRWSQNQITCVPGKRNVFFKESLTLISAYASMALLWFSALGWNNQAGMFVSLSPSQRWLLFCAACQVW